MSDGETPDDNSNPDPYQRVAAEFTLAILNSVLASIFAFVIFTTSKGPDVYFEGRKVSAEINASFFRWITYDWMNGIMWDGYERALEAEFLPSMTDQMRARPMYRIFARSRFYVKEKTQASLLWRIYITNRRDVWINIVFGVVSSISAFGMPYYLQKLLEYIDDKTGPKEIAYLYVFGMLVTDIIRSLTFGQNLYYGRRVDIRLRAMLSAEVYAKSLRRKDMTGIVSENTKKGARSDTGMITNLMAVDANRIAGLGSSIFFIYTCPIEILIAMGMLYRVLGASAFVGLGVMLLTFPVHYFAGQKYAKLQEQLMETRDRRVGLMSELLQGIRMIKFFTWEKNIAKKIMDVRDQELRRFVRLYIINTLFTLLWFGSPILVTVMSFTSYTKLEHKELTPPVAFTSLAIFFILRSPLNILPGMVTEMLETMVSIKRIESFLNEGEIWKYSKNVKEVAAENIVHSPAINSQLVQTTGTIGFTNATLRWHTKSSSSMYESHSTSSSNATGTFMLKNITLNFPVGKLSLICGSTGSGKTSLLMALLREMDLVSGSVNLPRVASKIVNPSTGYIPGALAYVSQYPWLQQASIRENIMFGSPFESERYQQVLEACALLPDLAVFEHGDLTEIGEKGITLSGGQKQRVALARAMYSRAQHLLFDDCLSAVDAHTARHLFENCLKGPLMNGRTRILVTHHVRLCLRDASYVALLKDGALALCGSPAKLIRSGMLSEILERNGMLEEDKDVSSASTLAADHGIASKDPSIRTSASPKMKSPKGAKKLVDEEARSKGKVKLLVYNMYLKACGGTGFWIILIFILAVVKFLGMAELVWIKEWSSAYGDDSKFVNIQRHINKIGKLRWSEPDDEYEPIDLDFYIGIYCLISLMAVFLTIVRIFWQFYGSLRASRSLYEQLLVSIIRAPIRFFDTTPVGRIINRFSKDFEVIDGQMISKMVAMTLDVLGVVAVILLISVVTPGFLIAAAFIAMMYTFVGAYYISSSRELKRIESVTKSPLYSLFGETLVGVSTIRAFGVEARFMEEVLAKLDGNNAPYYFLWMCNRWLSIRVDFMGAMVNFIAGVLILINLDDLDAGWAGISLGSAINFMGLIYWLVRFYTEMEMSLNSVERVNEYLEMPRESAPIIEGSRPPASWPYDGRVEIKDLTMQYAPDLGPVLHNISIDIRPREKIGIVGRTGSGKSTLALSLFRFIEPTAGSIVIDGIDISKIGLEDLRRRLTIIPQDAVLFNGTIRTNLDPFQEHADYEIWESLRRVHLLSVRSNANGLFPIDPMSPKVLCSPLNQADMADSAATAPSVHGAFDLSNPFESLDSPVSDGGYNFSQGQRQLLCMARALLRQSKVIIMDEATASVDFATDEKIQTTIRNEFGDSTLITVAHRLRTIMDYDRVLVLEQGRVAEFDSPMNLITSPSRFRDMVEKSGEYDALFEMATRAY
ncbi:P-loop containing nucleoside triphosphate hydrolase protein [Dissophora ornata]|nr:P-loop containing nucleoside triphosphate hydrolase protein [Dissophora ornata]